VLSWETARNAECGIGVTPVATQGAVSSLNKNCLKN